MKIKKRTQTKKILISAVALLASLGIAGGSTFAWFTSNSTVTVSGFTSNIVAGTDSLMMAVVAPNTEESYGNFFGTTYKTALNAEDIKGIVGQSTYLSALTPKNVGTAENPIYDGTAFTTESPQNDVTEPNSPTVSRGSFISFKIFFRNRARTADTRDSYIRLSSTGNTIALGTGNSVPFSASQYQTIAKNLGILSSDPAIAGADNDWYGTTIADDATTLTAYSSNAARISFITTAGTTETGKVWSPYEKFSDGSNGDAPSLSNAVAQTGRGYYLNNLGSDFRLDTIASATIVEQKAYTSIVTAGEQISNNFVYFSDEGQDSTYSYTAVKVNLWIEGTDGDCFDAILLNTLSISLSFEIARVESQGETDETP